MKPVKLSRFDATNVMFSIVKYGAHILFIIGIGLMAYLSFVNNLELSPSIRNITTIALIALVLNWLIWDSYYQAYYNNVMVKDIDNKDYCIHRRYYNARKGWDYKDLQAKIRTFNKDFLEAWLMDVEDQLGRKRDDIVNSGYRYKYKVYKGEYDEQGKFHGKIKIKSTWHPHRILIWRLKHRKYPKSGIKDARSLLSVLRVGKSSSMAIRVNAAEKHRTIGRINKLVKLLLSTGLAASLVYDFTKDDVRSVLLKLLINVVILFTSYFFGAVAGGKGGQLKLSIAEEVSEHLEEWKKEPPSEEPFNYIVEQVVEPVEVTEPLREEVKIEIT